MNRRFGDRLDTVMLSETVMLSPRQGELPSPVLHLMSSAISPPSSAPQF